MYGPGRSGAACGRLRRMLRLVDTEDPAWPSIATVLREMSAAGVELDESALSIAVTLGRHRWKQMPQPGEMVHLTLASTSGSIVYYIRRGHLIKIGTTIDPRQRFSDLLPDEILAVEPGGKPEETHRHAQFRHLKTRGEHFRQAPELMEHIRITRLTHGDPDPSWPTTAVFSVPLGGLPVPSTAEMISASEARMRLGISPSTLRTWVQRKKLHPVGRDERGHPMYFTEQLTLLKGACKARLPSPARYAHGGLTTPRYYVTLIPFHRCPCCQAK